MEAENLFIDLPMFRNLVYIFLNLAVYDQSKPDFHTIKRSEDRQEIKLELESYFFWFL